jgi:hypothetical protein
MPSFIFLTDRVAAFQGVMHLFYKRFEKKFTVCLPFLCLFDLFCEVAILFWSLYSVRTAGTPTRYICIDKFVLVLTSEVNIQIRRS